MGVLEASYRANGIKKGFLKEDEYVTFSEQAFSLGVVDYCSAVLHISIFSILYLAISHPPFASFHFLPFMLTYPALAS